VYRSSKRFRTLKGIRNRELRIRISIYQKSYIEKCTVSDRLKFLGASHNRRNRKQKIKNKGLHTIKGIENREQIMRISTYQKLCIQQYMIFDRLKFLFSVLCSLFLLTYETL